MVEPGQWPRVAWFADSGAYYDLQTSADLKSWIPLDGYPKPGPGDYLEEVRVPQQREFYRLRAAANLQAFFLPEVIAYQAATGITNEAAHEINLFLRHLRGAGVEPLLFWVGGSRYKSVNGSQVRAVIGGTGVVDGIPGTRGERYETFTGNQRFRFPNPLKNTSAKRAGYFAGAAPATESGAAGLISGGEVVPQGPRLGAAWGGGTFQVYSESGANLAHPGYGGFVNAGTFLPYLGAAYDGSYSVLCGIGKSSGSRETPLRFGPMPQATHPDGTFYHGENFVDLGAPYFNGRLHFAVITAADLTDNQRAYDLISIPRRSGWDPYGAQSAVVYLGDSITIGFNAHVWNSDGMNPPHKAGGQWNRNSLGLLANATGEGNDAQIEYFEKGARHALDTRTWNHLFFVCGSGGHYPYEAHATQNPLSAEAKQSLNQWVSEYHERIAIPAAEKGATVVQMTYIYGCPQNATPPAPAESYRAFTDYFVAKQKEAAISAGFAIFDAYQIPQLHAPLPAFYDDVIHPNRAGYRLIAQEFAASVDNPSSTAPRSLSRPAISGTAKIGSRLSCSRGSWSRTPTTYAYQWMRNATDIPGATSSSYLLQAADLGANLSCRVTATNAAGSAERTSAHSAVVVP